MSSGSAEPARAITVMKAERRQQWSISSVLTHLAPIYCLIALLLSYNPSTESMILRTSSQFIYSVKGATDTNNGQQCRASTGIAAVKRKQEKKQTKTAMMLHASAHVIPRHTLVLCYGKREGQMVARLFTRTIYRYIGDTFSGC